MIYKRQRERDNLRVNLTPLIDTVFLLLIFFMMTTTFNKQAELKIDLPEAKGTLSEQVEPIRILVNDQGEYAINTWEKKLVNNRVDTLKRALQMESKNQKEVTLLVSADAHASHQAVMKVMEAARDLGFFRLSFEAQQAPE
jgi:biopolymer transport protein ExbD